MTRVLLDGSHLRKRDQTGISSYARTLAASLYELGAEVMLLLGTRAPKAKSLPSLALAGQVLGNEPPRGGRMRRVQLLQATRFGWRRSAAGGAGRC